MTTSTGLARLAVADASRVSRRHPDTIRAALAAGDLHGTQRVPGGRWLIRPACLDAWLDGERCEHQAKVTPIRRAS